MEAGREIRIKSDIWLISHSSSIQEMPSDLESLKYCAGNQSVPRLPHVSLTVFVLGVGT